MSIKIYEPIYQNKINFVSNAISGLNRQSNVLDVGCGYGEFMELYREFGFQQVYGLDIDHKSIRVKNAVVASAENIPFKNNYFDIINCIDVVEHTSNDIKSVSEIFRILKRKGILVLSVPSINYPFLFDPINKILNIFNIHIPIGIWAWGHRRLYSKKEILKLLKSNGFKILKVKTSSHSLIGTLENYIPYIFSHLLSPLFTQMEKKVHKDKFHKKNKLLFRIIKLIQEIDEKYFSLGSEINLCIVAQKPIPEINLTPS
ncbi:class I SAM-dependent methyltransferase [Candidatus Woesearchaeota archaeon]|nr:class I SAM-dependent methyltransferase [Candidatus Woesearchaeota archaeon]